MSGVMVFVSASIASFVICLFFIAVLFNTYDDEDRDNE